MKTTKKQKLPKNTKKLQKNWLRIAVITVIALVCFAHILVTSYLFITVKVMKKDTDPLVIRSMVFNAVDGLRKPLPVNFATGDSYIPEAKVYIPRIDTSSSFLYSYSAAGTANNGERIDEEIILTSTSIVSSAKVQGVSAQGVGAFFDTVPLLQACTRAFTVKFVDAVPQFNADTTLQAKVPLQDGRTAFIYKDAGCKVSNLQEAQNALLTIRSY